MWRIVKRTALTVLLLLISSIGSAAEPKLLNILVRTEVSVPSIKLDRPTISWLRQKSVIKVGVWGMSQPPLYMGFEEKDFEGITADYLNIIKRSLEINTAIYHFDSSAEAIQALHSGEIDMLVNYNSDLYPATDILVSSPYLLDHSVILSRKDAPPYSMDDLNGMTLNYVSRGNILGALIEEYPGTKMQSQSNYINAVAQVVYGQRDAMWLNAATAEYLMHYGFISRLTTVPSRAIANINLSFAVNKQNQPLMTAINTVLRRVPMASRLGVVNSWGLGSEYVTKANPLSLTPDEEKWLREHPVIDVMFDSTRAPVSLVDNGGKYSGIAIDLLRIITARTGLNFTFHPYNNRSDLMEAVQDSKTGVLASFSVVGVGEAKASYPLIFTRPFLITPQALVVRSDNKTISSLEDFTGKRVALDVGNPLLPWLKKHYPDIKIVETQTVISGIEKLNQHGVDGVLTNQISADYLITNFFRNQIKVGLIPDLTPAKIVMATSESTPLLASIMSKAILELPQDTQQKVSAYWQNYTGSLILSPWLTYRQQIMTVLFAASLLIILFFLWNWRLREIINQREAAERALKDQFAFTKTLIDESPIALYVRDRQLRLLQCNKTYLETLATNESLVVGKRLRQSHVMDSDLSKELEKKYGEVLLKGRPVVHDIDATLATGHVKLHNWIVPYFNADGKVIGIIGGWVDMTEKEKLLNAIDNARKSADAANDAKSRFISSISHEIRTPLNAIFGLLELEMLNTKKSSTTTNENISTAFHSARTLLALIGEVLDVSKIESGSYRAKLAPTDIKVVAASVIKLFENESHKKDLSLILNIELEKHYVVIDALIINQILSNLISNAIKFTEHGSIEVCIFQGAGYDPLGRLKLVIEVSDTGTGLTEQQQNDVFKPYVQVGTEDKMKMGTGLGLNICLQLAELIEGELKVESILNEGSTFSLYFPAEPCETPEFVTESDEEDRTASLQILIVDDHGPNRSLLQQQLEKMGHKVTSAINGKDALKCWQDHIMSFDVTITDCNMPEIDGFELTRKLREIESQSGLSPHIIIGLTAHAEMEITEKCIAAGMTDCLFKPAQYVLLKNKINQLMGRHHVEIHTAVDADYPTLDQHGMLQPIYDDIIRANEEDLSELKLAVRNQDKLRVSRLAHRLTGSARMVNAVALENACEKIKSVAEKPDSTSKEINAALEELCYEVNKLSTNLSDIITG